jgi:hypothetical protein
VHGITSVEVGAKHADSTAARWGEISAHDLTDRVLHLDNATVTFVDGPVDSLVGVTLSATDPRRAGERHMICGIQFTLG